MTTCQFAARSVEKRPKKGPLTTICQRSRTISEWIYEVIVSPKIQTVVKISTITTQGRNPNIFCSYFGRNDDFRNYLWNCLYIRFWPIRNFKIVQFKNFVQLWNYEKAALIYQNKLFYFLLQFRTIFFLINCVLNSKKRTYVC